MLIALSGIDGSGKTTLSRLLARELRRRGVDARATRPRYRANELVKACCLQLYGDAHAYFPELNPDFYLAALLLDWLEWGRRLPAVDDRVWCCDRYELDVFAQAMHYGADIEPVATVFGSLPRPALTFVLDVPVAVASARLDARSSDRHSLESDAALKALTYAYEIAIERHGGRAVETVMPLGRPLAVARRLADRVLDLS